MVRRSLEQAMAKVESELENGMRNTSHISIVKSENVNDLKGL